MPAEKIQGPHFKIGLDVGSDGFLLDYVVLSDFGPFHARGPGMVDRRISEIVALAKLEEMAGSDTFKAGFADATKDVAKDLGAIVALPVDTLTGMAGDKGLVIVAPVDFLVMTPKLAKFLNHDDVKQGKRSVWLTGTMSPDLCAKLVADGWQSTDNLNWAPVLPQTLSAPPAKG